MTNLHDFRCSTLALDIHWASRVQPDGALAAHLSSCERCAAYLAHLGALDAARPVTAVGGPAPLAVRPGRSAGNRERAGLRRWTPGLAGGIALAAAVALWLGKRQAPSSELYLASKGAPAVQLLVRRGNDTAIWDGRAPVRPRDALALRAACEGFTRVSVLARHGGDEEWERLAAAGCSPDTAALLPLTLVVDEQPGSEELAVILSRAPADDATLRAAAQHTLRNADLWSVRFELLKAIGER